MDYSIVIPVFNCIEYTKKCIDSIYNIQKIEIKDYKFEIIVVDNHSTDSTPQYLKTCENEHNNFKFVVNKQNLGFAKACNIGAKRSKGKYIIFLNNDTEVTPEWSRYLIETIENDDDVWVAGSKCLYPDRTIQHAGVVFSDNKMPFHIYRHFPEFHPAVCKPESYPAVTGACMAVKRSKFLSLKGFDESYVNGYEDIDLCLKVRSLGKKIMYQPKSVIIHYESKTPGRLKKETLQNNYLILSKKWHKHIKPDALRHYKENNVLRIMRIKGRDLIEFNRCDKSFILDLKPGTEITEDKEEAYKRLMILEQQLRKIYRSDRWRFVNKMIDFAIKTKLIYIAKGILVLKREGVKAFFKRVADKLSKNKKNKKNLFKNKKQNVDSVEKLPISVILVSQPKKKAIVNDFVIPLLKKNKPSEIILLDDDKLSLKEKWAKGIELAKERFVFFCNDNILLPKNYLYRSFKVLVSSRKAFYVYSDYKNINISKDNVGEYNKHYKFKNYNKESLEDHGNVPTAFLIKKDCVTHNELTQAKNIKELWSVIFDNGLKGLYLNNIFYMEIHSDYKIFIGENIRQAINLNTNNTQTNKQEAKLPVSVVVTAIKSREYFTKEFVIPLIEANNPFEIILMDNDKLNVQQKRNRGASLATQKFILFCDDDVLLPQNHLKTLSECLESHPEAGYTYTDYQAVVLDMENHPIKKNYYHKSKEFDSHFLRIQNYIDTVSLIRKEVFCGFDENIKRLQDWDLWLSLLESRVKGKYSTETGFLSFYLDAGITSNRTPVHEAIRIVKEKHHLSQT